MHRAILLVIVHCIHPGSASSNTTRQEQKQALVDLFHATHGSGWNDARNWLTGDPCTEAWTGVYCDPLGGEVLELHLDNGGLQGTLPSSVANLSSLVTLGLSENRISGTIPAGYGGLPALGFFSMYNNVISGTLPILSGTFTSLGWLELHLNRFSGAS